MGHYRFILVLSALVVLAAQRSFADDFNRLKRTSAEDYLRQNWREIWGQNLELSAGEEARCAKNLKLTFTQATPCATLSLDAPGLAEAPTFSCFNETQAAQALPDPLEVYDSAVEVFFDRKAHARLERVDTWTLPASGYDDSSHPYWNSKKWTLELRGQKAEISEAVQSDSDEQAFVLYDCVYEKR